MADALVALAPARRTPLFDLHRELGGRVVPFAGWELPVQYGRGILHEHAACRTGAALFDVSHMGQVEIAGPDPAGALERLVPADIRGLAPGRARYTVFTDDAGGTLDDLIASNAGDGTLFLVVNAGGREADLRHLRAHLEPTGHAVRELGDRALLALQGPGAEAALRPLGPACAELRFMGTARMPVAGVAARVSRLGYTGEDGFEISLPAERAVEVARALLARPGVEPVGLGARDSLRLEAGLCLYGQDLDPATTPVEAGLGWTIPARRRAEGGFPGAPVILAQLAAGAPRRLVGLRPEGRAPARAGTEVVDGDGRPIGRVTSGGFGPTVGAPIAMGLLAAAHAAPGTPVGLAVRGKVLPAVVAELPFVPRRYRR